MSFSTLRRVLLVVILAASAACDGGETQTHVKYAHCGERGAERSVATHDETHLGTPSSVARRADSSAVVAFGYLDANSVWTSSEATVVLAAMPSTARLVEHTQKGDASRVCASTLEFDATVAVTERDRKVITVISGVLVASETDALRFDGRASASEAGRGWHTPSDAEADDVMTLYMNLQDGSEPLWRGALNLERAENASQLLAQW